MIKEKGINLPPCFYIKKSNVEYIIQRYKGVIIMYVIYFGNDSDFSKKIFLNLTICKDEFNLDLALLVNTPLYKSSFIKRLML